MPLTHERNGFSRCTPLRIDSSSSWFARYVVVQSMEPPSTCRDAELITSIASGEALVTTSTGIQRRWVRRSPWEKTTSAIGSKTVSRSEPGLRGVGPPCAWKPWPNWSNAVTRVATDSRWSFAPMASRMRTSASEAFPSSPSAAGHARTTAASAASHASVRQRDHPRRSRLLATATTARCRSVATCGAFPRVVELRAARRVHRARR